MDAAPQRPPYFHPQFCLFGRRTAYATPSAISAPARVLEDLPKNVRGADPEPRRQDSRIKADSRRRFLVRCLLLQGGKRVNRRVLGFIEESKSKYGSVVTANCRRDRDGQLALEMPSDSTPPGEFTAVGHLPHEEMGEKTPV